MTSLERSASNGEAGSFITNVFLEGARKWHTKEGEERCENYGQPKRNRVDASDGWAPVWIMNGQTTEDLAGSDEV